MKLSKLLLSSTLAAALVLGFAGCAGADDDEKAFSGKTVDFDNSYIFILPEDDSGTSLKIEHAESEDDKKNNMSATANRLYYYRAFKPLAQKHYGSTCVITIKPQTDGILFKDEPAQIGKAEGPNEGVAGFVFDRTDDQENNTYSFLIAAVRYDNNRKQVGTYISKYEDALVKDNNFTMLGNFTGADGKTEAEEDVIVNSKTTGSTDCGSTAYYGFKTTDFAINEKGEVVVVVKVEQNEESGAYTVSYYKTLDDSKDTTVEPVAKFDIAADKKVLGTGEQKYEQGKMAMYANIYPGQHFYADFAFKDTVGNDIPFEDEIIEE